MSLKDVGRHPQSGSRSNAGAERGEVGATSPGHETVGPSSAEATLTWADSASCWKRAVAAASEGTGEPDEATLPSASREKSNLERGELRLSNAPAHHTTAWCFARVSATYASR